MTVSEVFEMVDVIVDEFGHNGQFKSNMGKPIAMTKDAISIRGKVVLVITDTHTPSTEITSSVCMYYNNAMSYREPAHA